MTLVEEKLASWKALPVSWAHFSVNPLLYTAIRQMLETSSPFQNPTPSFAQSTSKSENPKRQTTTLRWKKIKQSIEENSTRNRSERMSFGARMKELMKKYGKVAIGVHLSVSTVSITGLYVAIKNNVDVESLFERIGLSAWVEPDKGRESTNRTDSDGQDLPTTPPKTNRTAAMVASSGGALALAILCNKVLFPIRVPITIALTPPIARYLAKRKLLKT